MSQPRILWSKIPQNHFNAATQVVFIDFVLNLFPIWATSLTIWIVLAGVSDLPSVMGRGELYIYSTVLFVSALSSLDIRHRFSNRSSTLIFFPSIILALLSTVLYAITWSAIYATPDAPYNQTGVILSSLILFVLALCASYATRIINSPNTNVASSYKEAQENIRDSFMKSEDSL